VTRGLRALVLAAVAVLVAGTAHTLADGCVDAPGLALALGICWPGAVAVLGRRRRVPALVAWTAGAQVVTHVVVGVTCGGHVHGVPARALSAHLLAVVVTAAVLARADAGLWAVHAVRRAVAQLLVPVALEVPVVPRPRAALRTPRPQQRWRVSPRVLRGPPSGLLPSTS
jgi:hypothetical protein